MTHALVLLLALLIGVVAGLRTFTAPAVLAWAAFLQWINLSGTWAPLYQVAKGSWADIDYEQVNFYTYTHPSSHFTWSMTVGRTTPTAHYALKNNRLTHRDATGGLVSQRDLSVDELEAALHDLIGLPVDADWRPVLEKVVAITGRR